MTKGVTITRLPDKLIPSDYLAKAASENTKSFGSAIARADGKGKKVVVKQQPKGSSGSDVDTFQKHEGVKAMLGVFHFGGEAINQEDVQPFVLVNNDDDTVALVAFLDGDFSLYEDKESGHSDEFNCVTNEIMPRIEKLFGLTEELDKIMDFLSEESTTNDWANFMVGTRGSITLLCCNGRMHTITVADDATAKSFDGWWTSNTYGWEYAKAQAQTTKPKFKLGGRPVASTQPITSVPAVAPNGGDSKNDGSERQGPQDPAALMGDPEARLTIPIPSGMDAQKLYKWYSKRIPEGMAVPKVLEGLKSITCLRKEATRAFLHTYMENHKLGGLGILKNGGTLPQLEPKKADLAEVAKHKRPIPIMAAAKKQGQYPPKAEAPAAPATTPQPEVEQPVPQVTDAPLPVFSPDQKASLLHFIQTIKPALDKNLQAISSPQGLSEFERRVETFAAQFGGKASLDDIPGYPQDELKAWVKDNFASATNLIVLLATERLGMSRMLDELTRPAERKEEAAPQQPAQPQAAPRKTAFIMPRRKTA